MAEPRRRRSVALIAVASAAALVLAGCGGPSGTGASERAAIQIGAQPLHILPGPAPTPELPARVHSADGHTATVTDAGRILPLTGSLSEVVFSLGLGERVVGRDVAATFAQAAGLPLVTRGHDVSAESVLSLRPTVVLADADTGPPEAIAQLRAAGVPVVVLPVANSLADVQPRIHAVADALGVPAAGDRLAERTQQAITAATPDPAGAGRPRVAFLYLRGTAGVYLIGGKGSGADALIAAAGGVDAGSELGLRSFTPITSEALIGAAPDVLLLMTDGLASVGGMSGLERIPGIAQTPAGKHHRVVTVDDGELLNFGPRTAYVITALAAALRSEG